MIATGQKERLSDSIFTRKVVHAFKKYNVDTSAEYEQKLQRMSTWDLAEEAGRHGLRTTADRRDLVKTLVKEFQKTKSSFDNIDAQSSVRPIPSVQEILAPFVR